MISKELKTKVGEVYSVTYVGAISNVADDAQYIEGRDVVKKRDRDGDYFTFLRLQDMRQYNLRVRGIDSYEEPRLVMDGVVLYGHKEQKPIIITVQHKRRW